MGKLCRQRLLLAGLALLCLFLPLTIGAAAENALSQGVSFSGITLAITAPEGDPVARQLEQVLSGMQDIRKYCEVVALEYPEAVRQLEQGQISAVLVLPEDFVGGILNGTNPDVELRVTGERPLEELLTFWVGQSASRLLAAAQSGIYTVLELYEENSPENLQFQDALISINLRYIGWTMNRQALYRLQQIPVTDQLPLTLHYSLSLFCWLMLALAPMFFGIYSPERICARKRFRTVGVGLWQFYMADLSACWLVYGLLFVLLQLLLGAGIGGAMLSGLAGGLFCAAFGSVCCLLTQNSGSCGAVSFLGSLAALVLSGGALPPVMMPAFLREQIGLSPITWLRNVMAAASGYEPEPAYAAALALAALTLSGISGLLYTRRGNREVAQL